VLLCITVAKISAMRGGSDEKNLAYISQYLGHITTRYPDKQAANRSELILAFHQVNTDLNNVVM
jgi:hypothetical protein